MKNETSAAGRTRAKGNRFSTLFLLILLLIAIALPMLSCELPLPKKEDLENQEGGGLSSAQFPDIVPPFDDSASSEESPYHIFEQPVELFFQSKENFGFSFLKDLWNAAKEGDEAVQALVATSLENDLTKYIKTSADVKGFFEEVGNAKIAMLTPPEGAVISSLIYYVVSTTPVACFFYQCQGLQGNFISVDVTVRYLDERPKDISEIINYSSPAPIVLYTEELEEGTLWVYRQEIPPHYDVDGNYVEMFYSNPSAAIITDNSTILFSFGAPSEEAIALITVEEIHAILDTIRISTLLQEVGG